MERTGIFLHNNTEPVRHDARWIEKNIRVQFVEKINLRRLLTLDHGRVLSKEQDSTAAITEDSRGGKKVLNVTLKHQTFDVCQLLVNLILFKPKLHSTFLLDSLFTTDLLTLKARGFNVDRILKANAAEARQREQARLKRVEEQQKVIEAESQRYREQEAQRLKALAVQKPEGPSTHVEQHMMPGQFDSPSPPRVKALSDTTRPITSNFFKSLGRHLGFEETVASGSGDQSTRALLPPPKTPVSAPTPSPQPDNTPRKPTQPFVLKANLQNAIAASRPHDSNKVFSFNQTQEVFEQKSYCDSQHGHDLQFMAETPSSIKLYIARKVASKEEFLRTQRVNIHHFSTLLVEIAHIFDLPIHTMHIFYDEEGPTIAFNQSGALFFNYRYFSELHPPAPQVPISADALVYWFVVACHELAHNIVQVHNSTHSFWTESFVQMYYLKAIERVWGVAAGKTETQRLQITQGTAQAAPQQPPSYSSLL